MRLFTKAAAAACASIRSHLATSNGQAYSQRILLLLLAFQTVVIFYLLAGSRGHATQSALATTIGHHPDVLKCARQVPSKRTNAKPISADNSTGPISSACRLSAPRTVAFANDALPHFTDVVSEKVIGISRPASLCVMFEHPISPLPCSVWLGFLRDSNTLLVLLGIRL
jgi:hypothetical protein